MLSLGLKIAPELGKVLKIIAKAQAERKHHYFAGELMFTNHLLNNVFQLNFFKKKHFILGESPTCY